MIKRTHFTVAALLAVILQATGAYQLVAWTLDDFRTASLLQDLKAEQHRLEELSRKPWRPWSRLSMSSVLIVGTLVLDGYLVLRLTPMIDD